MLRPEDRTKLERALAKHLARTAAPEPLWDRVREPKTPVARTSPAWMAWAPAAAALVLAVAGWMAWRSGQAQISVESLAVEALANGPEHLQFRSEKASEIRTWVRANSGIDIPLPPLHSPLVRIVGANVTRGAVPVAEVAYRVGDDTATLLVSKDASGVRSYPQHDARASEAFGAAHVSSWTMRGQAYTLAWTAQGQSRIACLLCHVGNEPPLLN
jgi:hypothetical protein